MDHMITRGYEADFKTTVRTGGETFLYRFRPLQWMLHYFMTDDPIGCRLDMPYSFFFVMLKLTMEDVTPYAGEGPQIYSKAKISEREVEIKDGKTKQTGFVKVRAHYIHMFVFY